jgi:hypothetical protein
VFKFVELWVPHGHCPTVALLSHPTVAKGHAALDAKGGVDHNRFDVCCLPLVETGAEFGRTFCHRDRPRGVFRGDWAPPPRQGCRLALLVTPPTGGVDSVRLCGVLSRWCRAVQFEGVFPAFVVVHNNENLEHELVQPRALGDRLVQESKRDSCTRSRMSVCDTSSVLSTSQCIGLQTRPDQGEMPDWVITS